ncbi:hypothetical protein AB2L28_13735 [Kineococcus sp. TBRC 1896]|uniref:VapC45 PIN like domain-containing protein n=1 Tax=Kineococcus mangrovi TaxID=1660183 RepID=A0ABV4I3N7_9ACTN
MTGEHIPLRIHQETIFVDRSLGAAIVPDGLRAAGLTIKTMRDVYGEAPGAATADVDWIAMAGDRGWIMFHKDARIRRNERERQAVTEHAGRMFCITNANTTGADNLHRFLRCLAAIDRAAAHPGPFIYGVDATSIRKLFP